MKSFRQTMLAICVILIASAFAGCGADTDLPDKRPALEKIEYTNLNDSGSRELLQGLLSGAGVSDGRIQSFFRRVNRFNDSVKQEWLADGFEEAALLYTLCPTDKLFPPKHLLPADNNSFSYRYLSCGVCHA